MHRLTTLMTLLVGSAITGCAHWPDKGRGGMAEHRQGLLSPVMAERSLGPEHGLRFELELTSRHLDVLILEGAELCFPATVVQARQRQHRIGRQLRGNLEFDAANDIIIQRQLLARLERQLDYVKQQGSCTLPLAGNTQTPADIGKTLHQLLNSDNQFAFDSSQLNPKYIARLAEAVQLLRHQPDYHLRITGHADAVGESAHNQQLSMARAQQVGRYLEILGLSARRLQFSAVGADDPLFVGQQPHIRLTNRRVSIELIPAAAQPPLKTE